MKRSLSLADSSKSKRSRRNFRRSLNSQSPLKVDLPKSTDSQKSAHSQIDNRFPYGNSQIDRWPDESRLSCFRKEWFENRDCLDVGCNVGFTTLALTLVFRPSTIVGIDIDRNLINTARKNLSICQQMMQEQKLSQRKDDESARPFSECRIFPVSMTRLYGPVSAPAIDSDQLSNSCNLGFCRSVDFRCENFVPKNDEQLTNAKMEFDTVMALNVTKWVHLNWGDDGLKKFFKRIYAQLRPGGSFILQPQPWIDYKKELKRRGVNNASQLTFDLKPEKFKEYLLSKDVGFSAFHLVAFEKNIAKGYRRPVLLFEKACNQT